MTGDGEQQGLFTRRAVLLAGAQGLLTATLLGRLYYLGVVKSSDYAMLAEDNRISFRLVPPERGEIVDRFGRALATNRRDLRIVLVPEQANDIARTLNSLGQYIQLSDGEVARLMRRIKRQRKFVPVTVADNLDWDSFAAINIASPNLPGVHPDSGLTRWYPDGGVAASIVGYVATASEEELDGDPLLSLPGFKIGKQGLEKALESELRGLAGSSREEVNANGRTIREIDRTPGQKGETVRLTIDVELQKAIAERLGEEAAAVVVMDTQNGQVYAYASTPYFNPNDFVAGISRENWDALLRDPRKPLINKGITGQYPPGSTFKMVVALAALEAGVIDAQTTHFCNGKYQLGNHTFHCWEDRGHGRMNLLDGLARSCDVYFYKVARELGIEKIAAAAERFGFGQSYGLPIPGEARGLVPTPGWKLAMTGQPWVGGETVVVGIGQGALIATPLQLAVMTARLANGGYAVTPSFILSDDVLMPTKAEDFASLDVNPEHMALVHRGMEMVLEPRGTAYLSRLSGDDKMAGKTGTAQVRRISQAERDAGLRDQSERPWKERHHAWFVGYGPTIAPRYAISVLIEHGGGGSSAAAPVGRDVMEMVLNIDPAARKAELAGLSLEADTDASR